MAIYIQPQSKDKGSGSWLWANACDKELLSNALATAVNGEDRYYTCAGPWDCIGDILLYGLFMQRKSNQIFGSKYECSTQIEVINWPTFHSNYYRADDLLSFYIKLKPLGWNILLRRMEDTMNNKFKMVCPSFEDVVNGSDKEEEVSPTSKAIAIANTMLSGKPDAHAREYSHPIDAALVKTLDNPIVNSVFKSFADMTVDAKFGPIIASGIPVNEKTFPKLNAIINHCIKTLRIKRPYVVVSGNVGFNAITTGSDDDPYIVMGNLLTTALSEEQLCFVIGHECGHVAMGHVVYHTAASVAGNLSSSLPVVGPVIYNTAGFAIKAWSRRSEITADRAGMLCCSSLELSKKTLMQLEMGFMNADAVDVNSYVQSSQQYRQGGILRKIGEYTAEHPILPKRIQALDAFAASELFYRVTNQDAPVGALSDQALTQMVENLIRVL